MSFPIFVKILKLFELVVMLHSIGEALESYGFYLYDFAHVAYHFDQRSRNVLRLLADAVDEFQHSKVHLSALVIEIMAEFHVTDCDSFLVHGFSFEYSIGTDQGPHNRRVFLNDHLPQICG